MKNWVDAVFIVAAILAFIKGYRAGFIATLFSVVGYIAGGLAGLVLGLHYFHSHGISKFFLLFLAVTIGSSIGEALLSRIGKLFHSHVLFGPFKWADSLAGALFSVVRAAVGLLILAHLLLITPWSWATSNIPKSEIYQRLNQVAPSIITEITKRAEQQIH